LYLYVLIIHSCICIPKYFTGSSFSTESCAFDYWNP